MTPHRTSKGGSFRIDKVIPGVGRIALASGTTHAKTFVGILRMIDELSDQGHLRVLAAIRDRRLTPLAVYESYRAKGLKGLPSVKLLAPLTRELDAFIDGHECGDHHRANMRSAAKRIAATARRAAMVRDLPATLRRLRVEMRTTPRMFNIVRATALAFASAYAGSDSKLRLRVESVKRRAAARRRLNHPLTVNELAAIAAKLPRDLAGMAWALALTGMRPGEYWGEWTDQGTHILVKGTKTRGAHRRLPRLEEIARPACWVGLFRKELAIASGGEVQPYDLRRTYATWLEKAQIDRTNRRQYLGHSAKDVTDLYETRLLTSTDLAADALKLKRYIDGQRREQIIRLAK
jgi:integrase